jgi:hypothetical protein
MQRPRYFNGQLLTAQDFQAEQDYHIEKRRLHNRLLHGFGVVDGLAVSVDDPSGASLVVSPGLGLDSHGNEILVESPTRVDLSTCVSDRCFVTIEYTETGTDPVSSGNGGVEFSRVTEGYAVRIASEDPSASSVRAELGLARLLRVEDRWIVDEAYRLVSLRR